MAYTTPTQRMTDLESEVFQGVHQTQRLTADVAALRDQGKLHNELLAEAMKDLRDLRIEMADFKTEVRSSFAKVDASLSGLTGDVSALKADVSGLKGDVFALKGDVSALKADVSGLKSDVFALKSGQAQHTAYFEALFKHLGVELPAAAVAASGE